MHVEVCRSGRAGKEDRKGALAVDCSAGIRRKEQREGILFGVQGQLVENPFQILLDIGAALFQGVKDAH